MNECGVIVQSRKVDGRVSGVGRGRGTGGGGDGPRGPDEPSGPNIEWFRAATFDPRKFDGFLLSPMHPIGRDKFRWLSATYGFKQGDGALFERLIREQLPRAGVATEKKSVRASEDPSIVIRLFQIVIPDFEGPNGNRQDLLTAWAFDSRNDRPHFTNAYPAK